MNSALQILYMNPIFRQTIYDLPLCEENDINTPSNFLEKNQKYEILLAIQKLFIRLQYGNIHSISTINLTESFKWEGGEGANQQDSQEFLRLFLYEILERILIGTAYDGYVNNLFKLIANTYMQCGNCDNIKSREEIYLDITLPVKDYKGMKESLKELFDKEEIISDYKCENCEQKVDLRKFSKLKQMPIFINFPLNRFAFDFDTFERIKVNDKYEFPLEVDMREYCTSELQAEFNENSEEFIYELYSLIVHRGTPYSGHYFSYIRDVCKEGNWNLEEIKEYKNEPEVTVEEKEKEKTNEEDKEKENHNNKNENENNKGKNKKGNNNKNNNKNSNNQGKGKNKKSN